MRPYWLGIVPNPTTCVLVGGQMQIDTQREDYHVTMGAEIRVVLP